jgi:hypothetical protein
MGFSRGPSFFWSIWGQINVYNGATMVLTYFVLFFFILLFIYLLILLYCTIFFVFLFFSSYI